MCYPTQTPRSCPHSSPPVCSNLPTQVGEESGRGEGEGVEDVVGDGRSVVREIRGRGKHGVGMGGNMFKAERFFGYQRDP